MNDISVTSSVTTSSYRGHTSNVSVATTNLSASHKSESTVDSAFKKAVVSSDKVNNEGGTANNLSEDEIRAAVALGNSLMQNANRNLEFQIDKATDQLIVRIVDKKSGELIRQIPSVEMLDFFKKMRALEEDFNSTLRLKA